jgi:peptidoglycan/xylan/chitin deacetylase (PgdA/CDA1 family)
MTAGDFFSALFPDVIFRINTAEKNLYLTFDDGPTELTSWVLEELEKYNAKATFFCVGANIEKNVSLYNEIINRKHAVGNHTMHHLNGWKTKTKKYLDDVSACDNILTLQSEAADGRRQTAGKKLFRPPYGRITPSQYFSLRKNHRIVMWDVLSKDYDKNISAEKCLNRVITQSKSGSVIVFHDSIKAEKNLQHVLPKVLEYFSEKKYSFLIID